MITLESRMNELEEKEMLFEKEIKKLESSRIDLVQKIEEWGPSTQESELISIETVVNQYKSLICYEDKTFTTVKVLARLKIQDIELETLVLVDTGCTGSIINKMILPQ